MDKKKTKFCVLKKRPIFATSKQEKLKHKNREK